MEVTAILGFILQGLASGALGKLGGEAVGYLLSLIGDKPSDQFDQIQNNLQQLETQMGVVEQDLTDISAELTAILQEVNWDSMVGQVSHPIDDIKAHYTTLQELGQDDTDAANSLTSWATTNVPTYLESLNSDLQDGQGGTNPQQPGLIRMYTGYTAQASLNDSGYSSTAILPGSTLAVYYSQAEQYFLYMVGVQLKGLTLLVNAYNMHGEADLAAAAIQSFQTNLAAQGRTFLSAVEGYTVNYAPDLSLLNVLGQAGAFDPIHRAGQTVDAVTNSVTFYARLWVGAGLSAESPAAPFSTIGGPTLPGFDNAAFSEANGTAPWLSGVGSTAPVQADEVADGLYAPSTLFPARLNCQWSVFRISWTNPPDGSYRLTVGGQQVTNLFLPGDIPVINTLIQPSNGQYFYDPAADFTFGGSAPANLLQANYVGRTLLPQDGNAGYAGTAVADASSPYPGVYNPGLTDFAIQCQLSIPGSISGRMAVLSSKCINYFVYDDQGQIAPGSTGFVLSLTPLSDGSDGNQSLTLSLELTGASPSDGSETGSSISATIIYPVGTWLLVTAGRAGGQMYLYLNGQVPPIINTSGQADNVSLNGCWNLMFGCENSTYNWAIPSQFVPTSTFYGFLNEVSMWHRALSLDDVKQIATQGIGPAPQHLYGYWSMADGTTNCFSLIEQAPGTNLPAPAMTPVVGTYYPKWLVAYAAGVEGEEPAGVDDSERSGS